jgi:hypothetical protein
MPKTIFDWVEAYGKKAGEPFELLPNATLWADHKHGIVTWEIVNGEFWVRHCSCDYKHWFPIVHSFAKGLGYKYALTLTKRNPIAYARLTGAKHMGDINDDHLFTWEV